MGITSNMSVWSRYIVLIVSIFLYSIVGVFTRSAATYPFLSWQYVLWVGGAVSLLGGYAILWQQLIQRLELSLAYMFKGLGVIFCLAICHVIFQEQITLQNIVGASIIVSGITLYAWTSEREKGAAHDL